MSKIKNQMVQPESTSAGEAGVHRRRFVRGVGIIVPAALTITSRSASAAGCLSASASASINLAHSRPNRDGDGICVGRNLTFWKTVSKTSSKDDSSAFKTRFDTIFSGGPPAMTMGEVMNANPFTEVNAILAVAWCNFNTSRVASTTISLTTLQSMWAGRNGSFQPILGNASVQWDAAQIVTYLKTTQLS